MHADVDVPGFAIGHADCAAGEAGCSKFGGQPTLLQKELLNVGKLGFALQFYGGLVPNPYDDVLYMNDAVGYLYLPTDSGEGIVEGLFFAQTT